MGPVVIDTYHYCYPEETRKEFYIRDTYTNEELEKTREIRKAILNFIRTVNDDKDYHCSYLESNEIYERIYDDPYYGIFYLEGYGYITNTNYDRDEVNVYHFGNTFEEAFKKAIYEYVMSVSHYHELYNREELNKDFSDRFLDGSVKDDDYHGPFYFAEYSIQLLRKYYGDFIPEEFIHGFENYVNEVEHMDVKYNYEQNRFVEKENIKKLTRNRGDKNDSK